MMEKQTFESLVDAYREGTATPEQLEALSRELENNEEARRMLRKQLDTYQPPFPTDSVTQGAYAQVLSRIEKKPRRQGAVPRMLRWAAACAAVLALGAGGWFLRPKSGQETPERFTTITASDRSELTVLLPDASQVSLTPGSSLVQSSLFSPENRKVTLLGEACFDIASDREHPFEITAGECSVFIYGTKFDLAAPADGQTVQLTLLRGEVDFVGPGLQRKMVPGECLTYERASRVLSVRQIDPVAYEAWLEGDIEYNDVTLQEFTERLESLYGKYILLSDALIRSARKYNIRLMNRERFEDVLDALGVMVPVSITTKGDTVRIQEKR